MPRNTALNVQFADNGKKWTIEQLRATDSIIRLQSGTNKYDSQRGMTGFGTPRDVRGKHLKRLWELEFPEETVEEIPQMDPVNATPLNPSKQPPAVLPKPISH
ncbi:calponin family repeat-containing domain protein [Onchocerca flexuosa]|nr:calponin family repeat-containing domain protein [Onchocerca flexuosa]